MSKREIEILLNWELVDWRLKESIEGQSIEAIVLRSKNKTLTLGCDALVNFNEKTINTKIFLGDRCETSLPGTRQPGFMIPVDPFQRSVDPG